MIYPDGTILESKKMVYEKEQSGLLAFHKASIKEFGRPLADQPVTDDSRDDDEIYKASHDGHFVHGR